MDKSITGQLARYRQLRATQKSLHHVLMKRLPKHAVEESGRKLGIYRNGALALRMELQGQAYDAFQAVGLRPPPRLQPLPQLASSPGAM